MKKFPGLEVCKQQGKKKEKLSYLSKVNFVTCPLIPECGLYRTLFYFIPQFCLLLSLFCGLYYFIWAKKKQNSLYEDAVQT